RQDYFETRLAPLLRMRSESSHHLARMEIGDRRFVIADRAQHLAIMRAGLRRHAVEFSAPVGQLEAAAGEAKTAIGRVDLLYRAPRHDLRMIDHLLDLPDAGTGRPGGIEDLLPFAWSLPSQRLLDDGAQRRLVLLPCEPVGKARI